PVPSNWELHGFGTLAYGFNASTEVGTYRRSFELPRDWAGQRVRVVFEGAMTDAAVRINGVSAGPTHQGGFYRFSHDVTALVRPGSNDIEVIVSEQSADASVNAAEREADYWNFGGIFRPVYLEASPPQSIERFAIDARADGSLGVDVQLAGVTQDSTLRARVFDANLAPVGEPLTAAVAANVTQVRLAGSFPGVSPWSAESPTRYRLALELSNGDGGLHAVRDTFGFRSVEVRPGDGIYVNGKRTVLRGANRHSFWPETGRALSRQRSIDDVQLMKDMNMNAVRSSHYPPDEHFLDSADALGLYVLDELAGWQSPPYDTAIGRRLIEEMVSFDVNHPSILFWDNGNEGGWNTALDAEFTRWDPQRRAVLHPWETFSDIDTNHYENYASTTAILGGTTLFMPTEFLHGLYDGGGGAGLDDYWRATLASRVGAGGFLWALVDEAVQRSPGVYDTAGNAAPDGILGPHREKEGSYYTIRQIWSPVQIATTELPPSFDGSLPVQNRYDATDLDGVEFHWQLVAFDMGSDLPAGASGHTRLAEGTARTASIAPGATGVLALGLPADLGGAQALQLQATDAAGRQIGQWSWMLESPSAVRARVVPSAVSAGAAVAAATGAAHTLSVRAARATFTFARADGTLAGVNVDGRDYPLKNGPTLSAGTAVLTSFEGAQDGSDYVVSATYSGDLERVEWRVRGDGWLVLSYRYHLRGSFDFIGVDFDCAEAEVSSAQWLGRGPSRVWKNRLRGPWHDLWQREKNDAVTGQTWDYPEFAGYFADVYWARLGTSAGPIEIVMDSPGLYLRLFTPTNGPSPRLATAAFPGHDISLLHGISAIGDKFTPAAALGPESMPNVVDGTFAATVYLHFGPAPRAA
ncbi:MAG TPA: glycoside hydrolase family 2 TIM barrel-domain containing protein, partial [Polyangiaceae bacterium]|nr:glycoside hydrolase family 2 TIM barrel-domain containing protein [Polyangiaceae bacterium]